MPPRTPAPNTYTVARAVSEIAIVPAAGGAGPGGELGSERPMRPTDLEHRSPSGRSTRRRSSPTFDRRERWGRDHPCVDAPANTRAPTMRVRIRQRGAEKQSGAEPKGRLPETGRGDRAIRAGKQVPADRSGRTCSIGEGAADGSPVFISDVLHVGSGFAAFRSEASVRSFGSTADPWRHRSVGRCVRATERANG